MALSVNDWNINPNITWFVQLSDSGSGILVELYDENPTLGSPSLVASADVGYGSTEVNLTQAYASPQELEYYNGTIDYHLKVSGQSGDSQRTFQVGPFTDLQDIEDPIYQSESMAYLRIEKEIKNHTRTKVNRDISLAAFENSVDVGNVVTLSTTREGLSENLEVTGFSITGGMDSVKKNIQCVKYVQFFNT